MKESVSRAIIESAVGRWITNLQKDTERTLRKLAELGEGLLKGKKQNEFFSCLGRSLSDPNSGYYKLVGGLAKNTDSAVLKKFGINFGYNALTCGAKTLRTEAAAGLRVPFCLFVECKDDVELLRQLIDSGRQLGIFVYAVYVDSERLPDGLRELFNRNADCAFVLFCRNGKQLLNADKFPGKLNTLAALPANDADFDAATAKLRRFGCLFGAYSMYEDEAALSRVDTAALAAAGCPFLFMMPAAASAPCAAVKKDVCEGRACQTAPLLVSECVGDVQTINESICGTPRFVVVRADGSAIVADGDELSERKYAGSLIKLLG